MTTQRSPVCRYVYDLRALAEHVRDVVGALPPRFRMFYAMKANSAEPVLRTLAPLVAGFEVASGGELVKARQAAPKAALIFGGPAKTDRDIAAALAGGTTRFHVESVLELHRISELAARGGKTADVLLRVNLAGPFPAATIAMAGAPTQFGIDETRLPEAVATAGDLPGIRLQGFHLHSLSNNLDADAHLDLLELYRRTITAWEAEFGMRCEVVNVGGGIGVDYADLEKQFDWARFAEGLTAIAFPGHVREIDFECGRFLVAACGTYETEVLDVKVNHGVGYVLVRGGTHHFRLPASWRHSHPFRVRAVEDWPYDTTRPELRDRPVTVTGELCTPKDVLASGVQLERVRPGDVLVFQHAGAYGWEISHHDFLSHPHPDHVFLPPT